DQQGVEVLLNQGDGTFQSLTPVSLGSVQPSALVAGDFNGDGRAGLAVGWTYSSSWQDEVKVPYAEVEILQGQGDGTFQTMTPIAVGYISNAVVLGAFRLALVGGDFAGDGRADRASAEYFKTPPNQGTVVQVIAGQGDGSFQAST